MEIAYNREVALYLNKTSVKPWGLICRNILKHTMTLYVDENDSPAPPPPSPLIKIQPYQQQSNLISDILDEGHWLEFGVTQH